MGYVEENLLPGETVRWRTRIHWSIFLPPAVLLIFPFAAMVVLPGPPGSNIALVFLAVLFTPISLVWFASAALQIRFSEFAATDKRILAKVGIVARSTVELYHSKVESVQVSQGVLGRAFDFGTVTFCGTGGSQNRFRRVVAPLAFRRAVQALMTGEPVPEPQVAAAPRPATPRGPICPACNVPVPPARPICPKCGQRVRLSRPA